MILATDVAVGQFDGVLDEARVWNIARSQAQIVSGINSELTSGTNLAARWGLNEGAGTNINDSVSTPAPATGTLTGTGATWVPGAPFNLTFPNFPPVATNSSVATTTSAPVGGTLTATDANPGDTLTYSIVTNGTHGTAVITDALTGAFAYTPSTSAAAVDTFTFKANDGAADSNVATVTVTITGLVGHWEMDGDITDTAAPPNDATAIAGPTFVAGKIGQAISLNGTSQYATVPDSTDLDITGAITMAAWVKPTAVGTQDLIAKEISSVANGYQLSLSSAGKVFVRLNNAVASRVNSTTSYPTDGNSWIHVAATWDGNTVKLYYNGAQEGSSLAYAGPIVANGTALGIGAQSDNIRWFAGAMDDVRLYNRALSLAEIQALANPAATLDSIAVTPANPSIAAGLDQQFTATGTYSRRLDRRSHRHGHLGLGRHRRRDHRTGGLGHRRRRGHELDQRHLGPGRRHDDAHRHRADARSSIAVTPASRRSPTALDPAVHRHRHLQRTTRRRTSPARSPGPRATTAVATIAPAASATAVAAGTSYDHAPPSGLIGGSTTLTVTAATLDRIAVTPANPSIADGARPSSSPPPAPTRDASTARSHRARSPGPRATTAVATIDSGGLATAVAAGTSSISRDLGAGRRHDHADRHRGDARSRSRSPRPTRRSPPARPSSSPPPAPTRDDSTARSHRARSPGPRPRRRPRPSALGRAWPPAWPPARARSAPPRAVVGTTTLTVTAATLDSIAVTPANPSIAAGADPAVHRHRHLHATTRRQISPSSVTWASADTDDRDHQHSSGLATGRRRRHELDLARPRAWSSAAPR